jgi:hypothetical protein
MRRRIGRRASFFAVTAIVCLALVPASPPEFRWVAWATAALAGFWAVMCAIEDLVGIRAADEPLVHSPIPRESETLFAPPPPPGRPTK